MEFQLVILFIIYFFFGFPILVFLLPKISIRKEKPVLMLLSRWLRWALLAGIFSCFLNYFEISLRPDWVHFTIGLMLWFLCETGYNWFAIKILSRSDVPLFPSFKPNKDEDEWPVDAHLARVKGWLDKKAFKRLCALKAQLFDDMFLRVSIYESPDQMMRIQILFAPKSGGGAMKYYTISANGRNNRRLITDNHSLPFGGYYPESWSLLRKPLVGSLKRLLKLHEKRLAKTKFEQIPFTNNPLEELNNQQRVLEHLNTESGFLNSGDHQEESGNLSYHGRYRLWKEMWLLAYFGKPVSPK